MRRIAFAVGCMLLVPMLLATVAHAACKDNGNCTAGTIFTTGAITYPCDLIVSTSPYTNGASFSQCDQCGGSGPDYNVPDGKCVICDASGGAVTIDGAAYGEVICGYGGNDTLNGNGGSDILEGGDGDDTLNGGQGDDELNGRAGLDVSNGGGDDDIIVDTIGNAYADGGSGSDTIFTADYDDIIYGSDGDDLIVTQAGADVVDGGPGNDSISNSFYGQTSVTDDIMGPSYCGGDGNDSIYAHGARHQCMNGGSGTDLCTYTYLVTTRTADASDVATGIDCETETGTNSTRSPSCGCN